MMRNNIIVVLLLIMVAASQLILLVFPGELSRSYFDGFRPLMYGLMLVFCLVLGRRDERVQTLRTGILMVACAGVLLYLNLLFMSGYFTGFAKNPMNTGTLRAVAGNAWSYLVVILIREYLRGKIMTLISGRRWVIVTVFIVTALLFTFIGVDNIKSVVKYTGAPLLDYILTILLPLFVLNVYFCYTARKGGWIGNLIFQTVYWFIYLFSPWLPDITKIMDAIFVYAIVLVMFVIVDWQEWKQNRRRYNEPVKRKYHWVWLTPPAALLVLLMLFGLGVFPYVPVAVASNSMKGVFSKGSLVVVNRVNRETLETIQVGDIIQFHYGKITVVHRVVEIHQDASGAREYVTKGDNNPVADIFPVKPGQVIGFARWYIPYIGYPALLMTSLQEPP